MAFADQVIGAESGGDPNAQNPNSSAAGPGQFIDATWLSVIKQNRPDLAAGKSDAAILGMRSDPQLSRDMVDAYANQNAQALGRAGIEASPGNLYLSHFAGPGGAIKVISADPGASAAAILGPQVAAANPFLRNMTAGQLQAWAAGKVGAKVASSAGSLPAGAAPVSAASPSPQPPAAASGSGQDDQLASEMAAQLLSRQQEDQLQPAPMMQLTPSAARIRAALARLRGGAVGVPFPSPVAQRLVDVIGNQTS